MDQKSYTNVPQDVVFRDKSVSELELADAVRAGAVVVNSPDPAGRVADVAGAHAAETGHPDVDAERFVDYCGTFGSFFRSFWPKAIFAASRCEKTNNLGLSIGLQTRGFV